MKSFYKRGIVVGGSEWTITDYNKEADKASDKTRTHTHGFTVVAVMKNGSPATRASKYMTRSEANTAFDKYASEVAVKFEQGTNKSDDPVYITVYDNMGARYDEYLGLPASLQTPAPRVIETVKREERTGLGWIIGGVVLGLGVLVVATGGKSQS